MRIGSVVKNAPSGSVPYYVGDLSLSGPHAARSGISLAGTHDLQSVSPTPCMPRATGRDITLPGLVVSSYATITSETVVGGLKKETSFGWVNRAASVIYRS